MSDTLKPMTEKELRIMLANIAPFPEVAKNIDLIICRAKDSGYILKSELQTLVDEAEEMYCELLRTGYSHTNSVHICKALEKQHEAIQLLKQSHPEFKDK